MVRREGCVEGFDTIRDKVSNELECESVFGSIFPEEKADTDSLLGCSFRPDSSGIRMFLLERGFQETGRVLISLQNSVLSTIDRKPSSGTTNCLSKSPRKHTHQ